MNGNFDLEQKHVIHQGIGIIQSVFGSEVGRRWGDNVMDVKILHDDTRGAVAARDARELIWVGFSWEASFEGPAYWRALYVKREESAGDLLARFSQWGRDRKIDTGGTIGGQLAKLEEEVWELFAGLQRREDEEAKDAIGDIIVVLAQVCLIKGWTVEECMLKAWNDIKDRKGEMVDGVFIKETSK